MTQSLGFILSGSPFLPLTHWASHSCHKELFLPLALLRLVWFSSPAKAWLDYYSQRLPHPHRTLQTASCSAEAATPARDTPKDPEKCCTSRSSANVTAFI